jgi:hypothetical protein
VFFYVCPMPRCCCCDEQSEEEELKFTDDHSTSEELKFTDDHSTSEELKFADDHSTSCAPCVQTSDVCRRAYKFTDHVVYNYNSKRLPLEKFLKL